MLDKDLLPFAKSVERSVKVPATEYQKAALISFSYNVGISAFEKSILLKNLNAGKYKQACDGLKQWVYAGGQKWKGLMNRRDVEIAALDEKHTSELSNALADNQKLSADVAAGARWVRIAAADLATCQLRKTTGGATGSLGNATQIELTAKAGRNILDIREGIISDQVKLEYLQGYVKAIEEAKNGNITK